MKFAKQFAKAGKKVRSLEFFSKLQQMLYKWKFFFILVKSYIISPLRLQCIVKNALFLRFLRSVYITYLITLSLEKEFIVSERSLEVLNFKSENLYKPWNPDNLGLKVEPLGLLSFFQQFAWWPINNISLSPFKREIHLWTKICVSSSETLD